MHALLVVVISKTRGFIQFFFCFRDLIKRGNLFSLLQIINSFFRVCIVLESLMLQFMMDLGPNGEHKLIHLLKFHKCNTARFSCHQKASASEGEYPIVKHLWMSRFLCYTVCCGWIANGFHVWC